MAGSGRITDGCKYLQDAMCFYGKWQGSREHKEWVDEKRKIEEERLENAKESINEKYIPIKIEIIRLFAFENAFRKMDFNTESNSRYSERIRTVP